MKTKKYIKDRISADVRRLCELISRDDKFYPGRTRVNYAGRVYDEKEVINLVDASLDFWLTAGPYAARFEKAFAAFLGMKYCLLTNSGSSADLLAISALTSPKLAAKRLKPGDEVITTACGFPTTLNPIIQNNLVPVFIDIDPRTYNIDADRIAGQITKKTRAILIAHTLGNPADIDSISTLVRRHDLWFIEDNADALGSKHRGALTGTFGHVSTCSFYPAHHMTMGEGGAVLTNEARLRRIIMSFRDWGRDCWCEPGRDNTCGRRFLWRKGNLPFGYDHKYIYSHIGYNLKITDLQAAIGCAQLEKLPLFIAQRKNNFSILRDRLKRYDEYIRLPIVLDGDEPSWFGFPVLIREDAPFKRGDIVRHLERKKIATRMLFGGNLTKQPAYQGIRCRIPFKLVNTDLVMKDLFWIGIYPGINAVMLEYICDVFDGFFRRYG